MKRSAFNSKFRYTVCCTWIVGLLLGSKLAFVGNHFSSTFLHWQFFTGASPFSFFAVNALPFVLTVLILYFADPLLVIPVVLFKSVLYGFTYSLVSCAFGDAAWLALFLISFSCTISTIIWFWYLLWKHREGRDVLRVELPIFLCVFALLSIFNFYVIAPLAICVFS